MKQFIEFTLGVEHYAVEMSYVREIIKPVNVMMLLGAPKFIKGVAKVRGDVITIIDLHRKFNVDTATCENGEPRIVILDSSLDKVEKVGLLVDEVLEILESDNIDSIPSIIHFGIIRNIIKLKDNIIPIIDIDRLFSGEVSNWLNSEMNV